MAARLDSTLVLVADVAVRCRQPPSPTTPTRQHVWRYTPPYDNDFRKFIIRSFGLKLSDSFVYRAVAEVTLLQAQTYLEFGGQNGLHGWYRDSEGNEVSRHTAATC
jgi:hypothetical protein